MTPEEDLKALKRELNAAAKRDVNDFFRDEPGATEKFRDLMKDAKTFYLILVDRLPDKTDPSFEAKLVEVLKLVSGLSDFTISEVVDLISKTKHCEKKLITSRLKKVAAMQKNGTAQTGDQENPKKSDYPLPLGVTVPHPYLVSDDGVIKDESYINFKGIPVEKFTTVLRTASFVTKKTRDLETGDIGSQVGFMYDGRELKENVCQDVLASAQKLLALSRRGVPVNSVNACHAIEYYDAQRAASLSELPELVTTRRNGWNWYELKRFYVMGALVISPDGTGMIEREYEESDIRVVRSLRTHGSFDDWATAFNMVKEFPEVLFVIGASLCSALLEILDVANFTVHVWGYSTGGKTVALRVALSVWGDPSEAGLLFKWLTTGNGLEGRAYSLNSMVLALDDNSQALSDKDITSALYMIGNAGGKQRATKTGASRSSAVFRIVALSNGEQPCTSSKSLSGQDVRVIEIPGSPFGERNAVQGEKVDQIRKLVLRNYGFIGPRYIKNLVDLVNDDARFAVLLETFQRLKSKRAEGLSEPFLLRSVDYFTAVELALKTLQDVVPELTLTNEQIEASISTVFNLQKSSKKETENHDRKALQYVWDRILSELGRFDEFSSQYEKWGRRIERKTSDGKVEIGYGFIQTKLEEVLSEGGLNFKSCTSFFKSKKWVWLDDKGQLWTFRNGGLSIRGYVFDQNVAVELGVLQEQTQTERLQSTTNGIFRDWVTLEGSAADVGIDDVFFN